MIGGPLRQRVAEPPAPAEPAPGPAEAPPATPKLRAAPLRPVGGVAARLAGSPGVSRVPCGRLEAFIVPDFLDAAVCAALAARIRLEGEECEVDADEVARRVDDLLGIDRANAEALVGLRVGADGREARIDFLDTEDPAFAEERQRGGQRTWTATLFLDTPAAGGEIAFPNAGLKMKPAAGHLLVWNNLVADGEPNGFSVHETLPMASGSHSMLIRRYRQGPAVRPRRR
jgi:prolyl 4-hydroxylase